MSTSLKECFLYADMDRLDHPEYFQFDFQCTELDEFFQQFRKHTKIYHNRKLLNMFYDRLISKKKIHGNIYVRLKWLVYFHQILSALPDRSPIFIFSQKALNFLSDAIQVQQNFYGVYEKYLCKIILKSYIQYLFKLCILRSDDDGQNINSINESPSDTKWFQIYNFITTACQTFNKSLKQCKNFFFQFFPFLNRISLNIIADIKVQLQYIKEKSIKNVKISALQIEEIQDKVHNFIWENTFEFKNVEETDEFLDTSVEGCNKEQITQFMTSGAKPKSREVQFTIPSFDLH